VKAKGKQMADFEVGLRLHLSLAGNLAGWLTSHVQYRLPVSENHSEICAYYNKLYDAVSWLTNYGK